MLRRVFFSFDHGLDAYRSNVVRESWLTGAGREATGFWDTGGTGNGGERDDATMKRLIGAGLEGTSVTVALIGPWTASKRWVQYEIARSIRRGNGLLGIHIHAIKAGHGLTTLLGISPLPASCVLNGRLVTPQVYDWVAHNGPANLGAWIEEAAQAVGR